MTLTVQAPAGAKFEFEEVKTAKGTKTLGQIPILVWEKLDACVAFYGEENILGSLDGTSFRVSFQGIARRMKLQNKSDDEIATAEVEFRPGKRAVGAPTPVSRAARAAKQAAEKVDGDTIAAFLEKVAKGEISGEDLAALASVQTH